MRVWCVTFHFVLHDKEHEDHNDDDDDNTMQ